MAVFAIVTLLFVCMPMTLGKFADAHFNRNPYEDMFIDAIQIHDPVLMGEYIVQIKNSLVCYPTVVRQNEPLIEKAAPPLAASAGECIFKLHGTGYRSIMQCAMRAFEEWSSKDKDLRPKDVELVRGYYRCVMDKLLS